jgi:hypothetical protein
MPTTGPHFRTLSFASITVRLLSQLLLAVGRVLAVLAKVVTVEQGL